MNAFLSATEGKEKHNYVERNMSAGKNVPGFFVAAPHNRMVRIIAVMGNSA
jgi:hypothetical protein